MSTDIGGAPPARGKISRMQAVGLTLLLLALALVAAAMLTPPVDVRITEAQARDALQGIVGEAQAVAFGTVEVTPLLLEPTFRADNRAAVDSRFHVEGFKREATAQGTLSGGIRYDSPHVFLNDIDASGLSLAGDDVPGVTNTASDLLDIVRDRVRRERDAMEDEAAKEALGRLSEQAEASLPDLTRKAASATLARIPVYDLNDAGLKGSVAALALQDVRFEQDAFVLTLSARAAMLRIIGGIGLVLTALVYFLTPSILTWSAKRGRDAVLDTLTREDDAT